MVYNELRKKKRKRGESKFSALEGHSISGGELLIIEENSRSHASP
jgi:hypothetical protein